MEMTEILQSPYGDANNQQDVIARCITGDETAFKSLYDLYSNAIYNTAYRIVNNQGDAEDMVQESFADAFRNISGFENRSGFGTWLKRILIHKCINLVKKKRLDIVELKELHIENATVKEDDSDEEMQWEINKILKGIQALPSNYRVIVSLYLLEGYDHEEIAQIMNMPEATIRTQYVRGKKKLVDMIKNEMRP